MAGADTTQSHCWVVASIQTIHILAISAVAGSALMINLRLMEWLSPRSQCGVASLDQLKLPTFLAEYDKLARECARDGIDHTRYLLRLAELELIERERRMVERRIRAARFPTVKSLDSFDFMAVPALNKMLVLELARGDAGIVGRFRSSGV